MRESNISPNYHNNVEMGYGLKDFLALIVAVVAILFGSILMYSGLPYSSVLLSLSFLIPVLLGAGLVGLGIALIIKALE